MRKICSAIILLAIAGCAQAPKTPPPIPTAAPVCRTESACSIMWERAIEQVQAISEMKLSVASETYLQTYTSRQFPGMTGEAMKINNGDGTHTIKSRFTCRYECDGLDIRASNLFNSIVSIGFR